jgi:hypothetical protein
MNDPNPLIFHKESMMKMPMKPMHGKTEKSKPMAKPLSKAEAAKKDKKSDAKFAKK